MRARTGNGRGPQVRHICDLGRCKLGERKRRPRLRQSPRRVADGWPDILMLGAPYSRARHDSGGACSELSIRFAISDRDKSDWGAGKGRLEGWIRRRRRRRSRAQRDSQHHFVPVCAEVIWLGAAPIIVIIIIDIAHVRTRARASSTTTTSERASEHLQLIGPVPDWGPRRGGPA